MRFLLLSLISAVLIPLGLVAPQYGILGYVWFAMMRPDALAWAVGDVPYSMLYGVSTGIGSLRYFYKYLRIFQNPFSFLAVLLQIPILLSVAVAVNPALCYANLNLYLRVVAISLLIPVLLETKEHVRYLVLVIAGSLGALGFKFALFGFRARGIQFTEGHAGFIADTNGLGLAMAMAVPLCWYAMQTFQRAVFKAAYLALGLCCMATVVLTFSRGSAVALAVVLVLISLRARQKIAVVVVLCVLAAPAVYLVYDRYVARLSTITTYAEDESAYSRVEFLRVGLRMAKDRPWLGVGFGMENQQALLPRYHPGRVNQVLHNTYLQILVDSGVFALILYAAMLLGAIFWLGLSTRRVRKLAPELAAYPAAFQTSLVAFAVGSSFYSRYSFELTYMLLMGVGAWYRIQGELSAPQAAAMVEPQAGRIPEAARPVAQTAAPKAGRAQPEQRRGMSAYERAVRDRERQRDR